MPDDLRKQIIEAIAASGDENYKRLLMLLLRVEEIFLERVDQLSEQLTVPVIQHNEDHLWITAHRATEGTIKAGAWKVALAVIEKGALIGSGVIAGKFFGGV